MDILIIIAKKLKAVFEKELKNIPQNENNKEIINNENINIDEDQVSVNDLKKYLKNLSNQEKSKIIILNYQIIIMKKSKKILILII